MEQSSLNVAPRSTFGKGACRKIRSAGKLPGVLYGMGNNAAVELEPRAIERILLTEGGHNQVFKLNGAGLSEKRAMIKDWQVDPVTRRLLHVDLLEIDTTKKVEVTVVLNFVGKSVGVTEGGVLNIVEREIPVKCFADRIPSHIDIDVSALGIGDSIHLDQLTLPEGVEADGALNMTLVTVVPPTKEEDAVASLTPAAEPEVITAKKPEADAAAPGGDKGKK